MNSTKPYPNVEGEIYWKENEWTSKLWEGMKHIPCFVLDHLQGRALRAFRI
jgi:hypothetical protein